jgi:hypothetical protein
MERVKKDGAAHVHVGETRFDYFYIQYSLRLLGHEEFLKHPEIEVIVIFLCTHCIAADPDLRARCRIRDRIQWIPEAAFALKSSH